jgi:hypothetical protein
MTTIKKKERLKTREEKKIKILPKANVYEQWGDLVSFSPHLVPKPLPSLPGRGSQELGEGGSGTQNRPEPH